MFAVKGWNVDADKLKPQTELFKNASDKLLSGESKASRKRKRAEQAASEQPAAGLDDTATPSEPSKKQSKKARKEEARREKLETHQTEKSAPKDKSKQYQAKQTEQSSTNKKAKKEKRETPLTKNPPTKDESRQEHAPVEPPASKDKSKKTEHAQDDKPASKEKSKKHDKKVKAVEGAKKEEPSQALVTAQPVAAINEPKLTPMQAAMRQKLVSARFRHLNETLYTAPSQAAQIMFNTNPGMFEDYHAGFRQQVSVWPQNPVDKMIEKIRQRGKVRPPGQQKGEKQATSDIPALPRTQGTCIIADCGCGDARLAETLTTNKDIKKLNIKVLSYDLHSPNAYITKADISNLPLEDRSVDVVIFCLALMGTNWISFIEEAFRVLHWKGELWIAEIKSRFVRPGKKGKVVEHSVGNRQKKAAQQKAKQAKLKEQEEAADDEALTTEVDGVEKVVQETDVQSFVDVLKRRGFLLKSDNAVDLSNKMFVSMEFVKGAAPAKGKGFVEPIAPAGKKKFIPKPVEDDVPTDDEGKTLKPCLYKIR